MKSLQRRGGSSDRRRCYGQSSQSAFAFAFAFIVAVLTSAAAGAEPEYDHHVALTPENSAIGNFPAQKSAILTIESGDTVRIDTGGGAGWRSSGMTPAEWLAANGIPVTAEHPVVLETLAVLEHTTRYGDIESGHLLIGPQGLFAGNLDLKELIDGSTLYVPVFHEGALFFTGDAHAVQGDGEIAGTAIETANTAVLQFILHKGRTLSAPRAETPTHYIAIGLAPDLDDAMQMAVDQTVEWLAELSGFDLELSIPFASAGIDYRITQIVDGTKGIHAMIPKALFVSDTQEYWYAP